MLARVCISAGFTSVKPNYASVNAPSSATQCYRYGDAALGNEAM